MVKETEWVTYSKTCGFNIVAGEPQLIQMNSDVFVLDSVADFEQYHPKILAEIKRLIKPE